MKFKPPLFLLFVCTFTFSACDKDDDSAVEDCSQEVEPQQALVRFNRPDTDGPIDSAYIRIEGLSHSYLYEFGPAVFSGCNDAGGECISSCLGVKLDTGQYRIVMHMQYTYPDTWHERDTHTIVVNGLDSLGTGLLDCFLFHVGP